MNIDKLDQKLLLELFKNARANYSQLGRKFQVSKEVINYRVERLVKNGIIKKFIPLIDFSRLGYQIYRLQLKFRHQNKSEQEDFFRQFSQTSWMVELQGNWDLVVLFWISHPTAFFQIVDKVKLHFGEEIQDILMTTVNCIHHLSPDYLGLEEQKENQLKRFSYQIGTFAGQPLILKEIEIKILKELMKDARQPILSLAKKLNSSATNVNYHLKNMVKKKLIAGFIPVIDHTVLGLTHFKLVLNLTNPGEKDILKERLFLSPQVIYITESYGQYDLEFEFVCQKVQYLFQFMEEISAQIPLKKYELIFDNREILVNEMPVK